METIATPAEHVTIQRLVSIIIIFLNEESFIREAIESVFAQTYDNWELLLVDYGSTDRSTQIARQYADQYQNYDDQKNGSDTHDFSSIVVIEVICA